MKKKFWPKINRRQGIGAHVNPMAVQAKKRDRGIGGMMQPAVMPATPSPVPASVPKQRYEVVSGKASGGYSIMPKRDVVSAAPAVPAAPAVAPTTLAAQPDDSEYLFDVSTGTGRVKLRGM